MQSEQKSRFAALSLAALGVVYGDIGTSPLYTLKEVFGGSHAVPVNPENVLGILSLVFWALMLVVSVKYVVYVMRADNNGEGGIVALMALALRRVETPNQKAIVATLGLAGAALFYGDGVITPAISVLSAVEGLEVATPALQPYVLPLTVAVLVALFLFQRTGTAGIGMLFGPIMMLWFGVLAVLGVFSIIAEPEVLRALNPWYAYRFMAANPGLGFLSLGAVVLALTGAEALYADMGHFGRDPIRFAWFGYVLPALVLNYFGQGALLMRDPKAVENPFYLLAPGWALYPMVALATAATVIASQAVISGAFSITQQAMQLGYSPRVAVQHTSAREMGQIYIPSINWALLVAVVALVLGFGSSTNLAAAYGIAVTGTMVITTILGWVVARQLWPLWKSTLLLIVFLVIDGAFFAANIVKIPHGGWFPLVFGAFVFLLLVTWKRGRAMLQERIERDAIELEPFIESLAASDIPRVPGTAIFLTTNADGVPHALLHNLKHNKVLHERVVVLTVKTLDVPRVAPAQRMTIEPLPHDFYRVKLFFGFMDKPDLPAALEWCPEQGVDVDPMTTSFFLGRETLLPRPGAEMPLWQEKLFISMFRNAGSAANYFMLPPTRVVELGSQVVL